ncbi:dysbindin domain-containing protein 1 isoform X2 [Panthera tigris]|uniref:dysbindin domain-containing protein 1 isoform X2 n=1 Tax=Panthera tigris TaxID=9694 RepID=UPI001C6FA6C7|nr:dysbindin domain-containing protein 1 isoform X2 [Panthera tigris]
MEPPEGAGPGGTCGGTPATSATSSGAQRDGPEGCPEATGPTHCCVCSLSWAGASQTTVWRTLSPSLQAAPDTPRAGNTVFVAEMVKENEVPQAALGTLAHGTGDSCHSPTAEEEVGIPIPAPGLLQVTERRQPLSSVSSLEVHFDLLDLTELTDMSDQELAEVFADSDDESLASESPAGLHPLPRSGCLRSPSWTRTRAEQNREKQPLGDQERQPAIVDTFLTVERPKED